MVGIAFFIDAQTVSVFGIPLVMASALLCLTVNLLVFVPAAISKTEKYFDATGSLTYLMVMGMCLATLGAQISMRAVFLTGAVAVWALRLGTYLMRRIHAEGKDGRFDELKKHPSTFIVPWVLQALWVFLTSLAVVTLLAIHPNEPHLLVTDVLGGVCWVLGFAVEATADAQKAAFRKDPNNAGRFIQSGLWGWSQHPNYFGEILLWSGLFVVGAGFFEGSQWLAALSPLFVYVLLTRISGINLLDERAVARWGHEPAYQTYRKRTPVLFPRPPRG